MFFTFLIFLSAFLIEAIGTYVSVIGLSAIFASNPIIIALAIALDVGKVVAVSFVYKYWSKVNLLMKSYMTIAAMVLVLITSTGAFGFLSGEFQKAIAGTQSAGIVVQTLTEEQGRLQKRKEEIDKQIARLPDNNVRGRQLLMRQFDPEVKRINERLIELDKKIPELRVANVDKELHVGPIIYVANAFDTTPEKAVKWVILIIIFVFDPLAIALILAGNFLIEERAREKLEPKRPSLDELLAKVTPDNIHPEIFDDAPVGKEWGSPEWDKAHPPVMHDHVNPDGTEMEPTNYHAPQQPTIQELITKEDTRKFDVVAEQREKVVIKPPAPKPPKVKVKAHDDKEVITIEKPVRRSMLENVHDKADIMPAARTLSRMKGEYGID